MSEFKKGQLVAAWSSNYSTRHIRIFVEIGTNSFGDTVFMCREAGEDEKYAIPWPHCLPLEEVEPGAFIDWERRAGEQAADAVAMESELVQRLRRQIAWLCQELNQINSGSDEMCHCPDPVLRFAPKPMDCHPEGCANCWEQASLKAVKEKPCP